MPRIAHDLNTLGIYTLTAVADSPIKPLTTKNLTSTKKGILYFVLHDMGHSPNP